MVFRVRHDDFYPVLMRATRGAGLDILGKVGARLTNSWLGEPDWVVGWLGVL